MEFEVDALKKLKSATVKNINELGKKSDLTSAETKALVDGFNLMDRLCYEIEDCEMKETGKSDKSEYSGNGEMYATPRRYSITSYGRPHGRMSYDDGRGSYDRSYGYYMDNGRSSAEPMGRSYAYDRSMNYPYMDSMQYGDMRGYSRHSIGDRAISCLEHEMDGLGSDYERREMRRFIEMIRSAE